MIVTRNDSWLQRVLYLIIAVLGVYIVYKSGAILLRDRETHPVSGSGVVQKNVEDTAVRTLAPGYAAAVEGKGREGWLAGFMEPLVPVYSYMAEARGGGGETDTGQEEPAAEPGQETAESSGEGADASQPAAEPGQETVENGGEGADAPRTAVEPGQETVESGGKSAGRSGTKAGQKTAEETAGLSADASEEQEKMSADERTQGDSALPSEESAAAGDTEQDGQTMEVFGRRNGLPLSLLKQIRDFDYLLSGYYTLDESTSIDSSLLDAQDLLSRDLSIQKNVNEPQILIYHTHSQEEFADSVEGDVSTSIVGMGEVLTELLRDKYGYQVIHDTGVYDLVNGVLDRSAAYDYARESVEQILAENPAIEVVIDLHRDGVDGYKFVTEVNGKPTSKIMFFNGLSRDAYGNPLTGLENPYIEDNLAFSLQMQLLARQQYPDFTRNIYLKAERYNLHLRARSLLIEAGTQLNTVEEERNAMEPLAALLAQVLGGAG